MKRTLQCNRVFVLWLMFLYLFGALAPGKALAGKQEYIDGIPVYSSIWQDYYEWEVDQATKDALSEQGIEISCSRSFSTKWEGLAGPSYIRITENYPGALKKGSKIYLKMDTLKFYPHVTVKNDKEESKLELDASVNENGTLVLTVLEESTTSGDYYFGVYADTRQSGIENRFQEDSYIYHEKLYLLGSDAPSENLFLMK